MERSNFLVAIIKLILRSLAIIPGWFVSLGHEIVTFLFILEIWGNAGDAFSSTSVGKYGFGHYDLNPPQSQLLAGRYGKPGTYVRPHRHPHTFELLLPLRGRFVV
ncbi:hypothetical protein ACNF5F_25185, partial [Escherichia coli]